MPSARLLLYVLFLLFPTAALAGAVSVLPGPPVVADGKSTATVRIYAPGVQGTDKVRVSADEGRLGAAEIGADGVITVTLIPPLLKAPRELPLSVKIQGASLRVEETVNLSLVPPYAGTLKVTFDPPEFVGGNSGVLVRVTPDASTPQSAEARRMLGAASVGTLDAFVPAGDGTYVSRWTPPAGLTKSRTAIVAVADAAAPDKVVGWAALPVLVKQSITLNAPAGSNNILLLGDRQYGPIPASPAGTVAFDVELNPAKTAARLQSVGPGTARAESPVELPLDDYNRVAFFPTAAVVPADPEARLTVYLAATKKSGEPLTNAPVSVRATAGLISPPTPSGKPGIYQAVFTPTEQAADVVLTAEVEGSKAELKLRVVPALPSVSLSADPEELPKNVNNTTIVARVKDARGSGIVGRAPELTITGGKALGKAVDNKDGSYTTRVTLTSKDGYMLVTADPPVESSGLAPARIVMWPARGAIPANGSETMAVTVAALDAFGMPVSGVKVKLAVPLGDGTLPPEATTNAKGLARVTYRGGTLPGPVALRADAAGLWTQALVFQQGPGALAPAPVPTGSPEYVGALMAWQGAAPALVVSREGTAPMAKAGPPAVVTLSTVPPYTTPGAAILVVVRVSDAAGLASLKQKLNVTASLGKVGAITDNGDGSYSFPLQLPAGQDGPVTINVGAGTAQGSVVLPTLATLGAMPAQPGAAAAPAQPGEAGAPRLRDPGSPRQPRPPKASRGPMGEGRWARLDLSLGTVARKYSLEVPEPPEESDVPPEASFQTNALFGAPGLDVGALLWPGNGAIGVDLDFRGYTDVVEVGGERYSQLGWSAHGDVRYRGELTGDIHWYGTGGVHRFNGLVFRYADDAKTQAELLSKGLWGARLGGGLTYESEPIYVDLQLAETFAPWPVDTFLGMELGYDLQNRVSVRLSYGVDLRSMTFAVGEEESAVEVKIKDQERPLMVGAGYVF